MGTIAVSEVEAVLSENVLLGLPASVVMVSIVAADDVPVRLSIVVDIVSVVVATLLDDVPVALTVGIMALSIVKAALCELTPVEITMGIFVLVEDTAGSARTQEELPDVDVSLTGQAEHTPAFSFEKVPASQVLQPELFANANVPIRKSQ